MQYIDEKFKDEKPEKTVEKIIETLKSIGIELEEVWNDSKIENCCSLRVIAKGTNVGTNGKGITKEFARASAYGEFMERLQSGLFFYKYQSFENDQSVFLHSFAPDKKYMTKEELLEDSEWMQPIVSKYGITKETIANQCQMYAASDKILTLPYYSLFEDRHVYIPAAFVEHIYSANGCCVGNTPEEAWVHALSEIFERNSSIEVIKSGKPVPVIKREKLKDFKTVNKILDKIEAEGKYDVEILDYSCGKGFPVVSTRIINKETKGYIVDVGADPVFEIAVERTLTEIFQGRNLENFSSHQNGQILNNINETTMADNVTNQLETGNGLFTVDFFADGQEADDTSSFPDKSDQSNKELLKWIIEKYKALGFNVYIRNNSFLGFPCYKFIVPGYSESRGERLIESVPTYCFGDRAAKTLRNIKSATNYELNELLMYRAMIKNFISRRSSFVLLSGLPLEISSFFTAQIHFAYAAFKIGKKELLYSFLKSAITAATNNDDKDYLAAVKQWLMFKDGNVDKDKAIKVISKFYYSKTTKRLIKNIENDSLFDEFLIECKNCDDCRFKEICFYDGIKRMISFAGEKYAEFTSGQEKENFTFWK